MTNDKDITKLFRENNYKILISQLLQDVANNDDSLRLSLFNQVDLISLKLQQRLNNYLKSFNINYEIKDLVSFIEELKQNIKDCLIVDLDNRKNKYIDNVNNNDNSFELEINEKRFISDELDKNLNKIIYIDSENSFFELFKLSEDYQKDEVILKCFERYDSELSKVILDSIIQRDNSLKNTIIETRKRVNQLNIDTVVKYSQK